MKPVTPVKIVIVEQGQIEADLEIEPMACSHIPPLFDKGRATLLRSTASPGRGKANTVWPAWCGTNSKHIVSGSLTDFRRMNPVRET